MIADDYRTSPIWQQTRHLVLAISLTADSFQTGGESLSQPLRRFSIELLLGMTKLSEGGTDLGGVLRSVTMLEQILLKSHEDGYLRDCVFFHLTREVHEFRSTLKQLTTNRKPSLPLTGNDYPFHH